VSAKRAKEATVGRYQYEGCGLPNVYLQNGFEIKTTSYGKAVSIRNVEGLHEAIADHLVLEPAPLTSDEFRYLRVFLELSQKKLGELLGLTDQTIANWEKGKTAIDRAAETLLRMLVREHRGGNVAVRQFVERINEADRQERLESLTFRQSRGNAWRCDPQKVA
jgi:DNA-binding transcriptional regulator YiaG